MKINKSFYYAVTIAFVLWGGLSNKALAKGNGVEVTVSDPYVEMRTGPGRGYPIFHVVERGDKLRIYKRRTDWFKVESVKGKMGWVKRDALNDTLGPDGARLDFSAADWQDFVARRYEFGVLGGDFSGAQALTTYFGYHLTHNIAFELKYTQAFGNFSNSQLLSVNAVHQPFPEWTLSPFFTLGSGMILISPSSDLVQAEDRENGVLTVGGGLFLYMSRQFLLRFEYNDHTVLTSRELNEEVDEWKVGFSVFF